MSAILVMWNNLLERHPGILNMDLASQLDKSSSYSSAMQLTNFCRSLLYIRDPGL